MEGYLCPKEKRWWPTRFYITDREEIPNIPPLTSYNVKSFIIFLGAKGTYSAVPQHELTGENIIFSHCTASWHPRWKEARCRIGLLTCFKERGKETSRLVLFCLLCIHGDFTEFRRAGWDLSICIFTKPQAMLMLLGCAVHFWVARHWMMASGTCREGREVSAECRNQPKILALLPHGFAEEWRNKGKNICDTGIEPKHWL